MFYFSKSLKQWQLPKVLAVLLLFTLLVIADVPGYLTGRWFWMQPLPMPTLRQLRNLRSKGLTLPGWQTVQHQQQKIGEHKWLVQIIKHQSIKQQVTLLLLPQNGPADKPQTEWTDINSLQRWKIDHYRLVEFRIKPSQVKVTARFFRGWNNQQTFAVLQWYAWSNGGHPAPSHWFWADQLSQWHHTRLPWVAVSIIIPIEPLGDVETSLPLAQSVGTTVQAALMSGSFQKSE